MSPHRAKWKCRKIEVWCRSRPPPGGPMAQHMTVSTILTCGTDTVATLSPFTHETRGLSGGRVDGVEAVRHRDDAVDAT